MKYDGSRITYNKEKHYSEVLMQQGRVQVDADWNEQQAINRHRIETEALDVIGESGMPEGEPHSFEITQNKDGIKIGRGRYYVDGILCENEIDVPYDNQPDLPGVPTTALDVLKNANPSTGLVYLDVWQRHITAIDDPLIREVALGGPDTATRVKTVWQVKILPVNNNSNVVVNCNSPFPEWDKLVAPGTGTLNARTQPPGSTDNLCLLPPSAGYQRLENQLYRIEIHKKGTLGSATFKWSRDNGSVVTAIEKISPQEVTVHDVGPDDVLGFASGQWAEIVDDVAELNGEPGQMVQIDNVDPARRVITFTPKLSLTGLDNMKNPKLRRWDSASDISVEVPEGYWIPIEGGIEVKFDSESNNSFNTGDYWLIPARTVTGEIEWPPYIPNTNPLAQLPPGIQHHYCRLALIISSGQGMQIIDCRKSFPLLTEVNKDAGCCISMANIEKFLKPREVQTDEVNTGVIFKVFKDIKDGYVICLLGGEHRVDNLMIEGPLKNIVLRGCSRSSKLIVSGKFSIMNCEDVLIESLDISGNIYAENVKRLHIRENNISAAGIIAEWNAQNFSGFFYDINEDLGREKLQLLQANLGNGQRTIDIGQLVYSTGADPKMLNVVKEAFKSVADAQTAGLDRSFENGSYYIVGWQGEKYVAINGRIDKLARLLFEQGKSEKKTLTTGETWDMGGGWTLTPQEININAETRKAYLVLSKDGVKKDDMLVSENKIYTYVEKSLAGENNVPMVVTYIESIFAGVVQLGYTWVIDTVVTTIKSGDLYGKFQVSAIDTAGKRLILINTNQVSLGQDSTDALISQIQFRVADQANVLRFMPVMNASAPVETTLAAQSEQNTYEVRGSVADASIPTSSTTYASWNAQTFAGFFYDIKNNNSTESLTFMVPLGSLQSNRTIPEKQMIYSTGKAQQQFKMNEKEGVTVNENTTYSVVGWQAEKWVAVNNVGNKIAKLVLEMDKDDKKALTTGETWSLGAGYELTINAVDARATPRQVWFTLKKDGAIVDEGIGQGASSDQASKQNAVYFKTKTILGEQDALLFTVYVDSIFSGATSDMVQFKYAWLIDESSAKEIKVSDTYGAFEVQTATSDVIILDNKNSVSLSKNTETTLMGNLKFRVSDQADVLRFMPITVVDQPAGIRGTIWNEVPLPGALGASSFFELVNCSATIESNSFLMKNGGLKFNLQSENELNINENIINVTNGTAIEIITDPGKGGSYAFPPNVIQLHRNTIEVDNGYAVVIIPQNVQRSGITASEIPASITRATDLLSSFPADRGFIRINDNSFSSTGVSNVIIFYLGKIDFIGNFCRSVLRSFINSSFIPPIFIEGNDINFSNNQCTLLLPLISETGFLIMHVSLSSRFASVIGNICRENLRLGNICSIKASGENSILLGNGTTNSIQPPDPTKLNIEYI